MSKRSKHTWRLSLLAGITAATMLLAGCGQDPPRAGSDRTFLSSLIALSPQKVVYISCNPETQQRDLRYLTSKGPYRVTRIQPVDMFPHTNHVETVALLQKQYH